MARRAHNSQFPEALYFKDVRYDSPTELYRSVIPPPKVSLQTFIRRLKKYIGHDSISENVIDESLYTTVKDYQRKYSVRKTWVEVDGELIVLESFYQNNSHKSSVSYRTFWDRLRKYRKGREFSIEMLKDALSFSTQDWISFYGGGRHRSFTYEGELYPQYFEQKFHGISAFLKTINRYSDKGIVWSRIKAGWDLDLALTIPVEFQTQRKGRIYKIIRTKTEQFYVGLTWLSVKQRWAFHIWDSKQGSRRKLAQAIREDGREGFTLDILEDNIETSAKLKERECYWAKKLDALGPMGLNVAKPGGLGSPLGKPFTWEGETFPSITEAAYVVGERLGLPPHVVERRFRSNTPLPKVARKKSSHPEAGSNLFRRWLALKKRHPDDIDPVWRDSYDSFKTDVSLTFEDGLKLIRKDKTKPWRGNNWEWATSTKTVEATHGKLIVIHGVEYPSIEKAAKAFKISPSTLKHRIRIQGLSPEEAVDNALGVTSYKKSGIEISIDGKSFRSKRQAILYISEKYGLTEGQAKYRFEKGDFKIDV